MIDNPEILIALARERQQEFRRERQPGRAGPAGAPGWLQADLARRLRRLADWLDGASTPEVRRAHA